MRIFLDTTCPRCGIRTSHLGLSIAEVRGIQDHVCADGVRVPVSEPVERVVLGPGERLSDKEEPR